MKIFRQAKLLSSKEMADMWKARHGRDAAIQFSQVLAFIESQGKANAYFYKVRDLLSQ
jgi:hypothetical protein